MGMSVQLAAITPEQLGRLVASPDVLGFLYPDEGERQVADELDIEKSWHGLHYLLTGEVWGGAPPLADAVLGGRPLGDGLSYGPAMALTPDEVKAVAGALEKVTHDQLRERYGDGSALMAADIYPQLWDRSNEIGGYLLPYFDDLVAFYRRAADNGHAVLHWLS